MGKSQNKTKSYIGLSLIILGIIISYQVATKYYHFIVIWSSFWFIDSAWYEIPYQEYSSVIIWLTWIILCVLLWIYIWITNNEKLKIKLWVAWIIVWLLSHAIWWWINPMYRFDNYPETYWYMDSNEEYIEDVDKYIDLFNKYWSKFWNNFRPLKSLENHIKVINHAIVGNYTRVWSQAIDSAWEIYWYDKLFEKYKDKTAETYYLQKVFNYSRQNHDNWLYDSYEWFYYIKDNWSSKIIKNTAQRLYEWYEANKEWPEIDFFDWEDNWIDRAEDEFREELMGYKWLNNRMLYRYWYRKDKFFLDEKWDWNIEENYYMENEKDKGNWY
jgi:hypothetical protein